MPLDELTQARAEKLLAAFCERRVPKHLRDKVRLNVSFRGNSDALRRPALFPRFLDNPSSQWKNTLMANGRGIILGAFLLGCTPLAASGNTSFELGEVGLQRFAERLPKTNTALQQLVSEISACEAFNTAGICCARIYTDKSEKTWIIERCSRGMKVASAGIYVVRADFKHEFYPWFDTKFQKWACSERYCSECSWRVTVGKDGSAKDLLYRFRINLTHGRYRLKPQPGLKRLKVIEKKETDEPS